MKRIVFDMDNTLVDEFGAAMRPGITDFLETLKNRKYILYLWTSSTSARAKDILRLHKLDRFFDRCIYREDYDPGNTGVRKDIRKIGGEMLIDDDPAEIRHVKSLGLPAFLVKPYRKNSTADITEYKQILNYIESKKGLFKRVFNPLK